MALLCKISKKYLVFFASGVIEFKIITSSQKTSLILSKIWFQRTISGIKNKTCFHSSNTVFISCI
ncbi:MAG: hypothetical protein LBU14_04825 [Candidatus Peribacteria bacterium]|nr:hypothetical protein [Candidatus Peribacteria bacterium]